MYSSARITTWLWSESAFDSAFLDKLDKRTVLGTTLISISVAHLDLRKTPEHLPCRHYLLTDLYL
jgi:hypothetical protein